MNKIKSNPWIETVSGIQFEFLNPTQDMISIGDIAHALSMSCRYAGHCKKFYSVAEHSVFCSHLVSEQYALQALLHDASEAYIADVASPVKQFLFNYKELEQVLMEAISLKFNVSYPLSNETKHADLVMLSTEAHHLLLSKGENWNMWEYIKRPSFEEGCVPICLTPFEAKAVFLKRFHELYEQNRTT